MTEQTAFKMVSKDENNACYNVDLVVKLRIIAVARLLIYS